MDVERILSQLVRVGMVTAVDARAVTARVIFDDQDEVVSHNLSVVVKNTAPNADYWMPDINEQVLCLFLPVGIEQGWVLGSFYDETTSPPASSGDSRTVRFGDGTTVSYDRKSKRLIVDAAGDVNLTATGNVVIKSTQTISIDAPDTVITGNTLIKGKLTFMNGVSGRGGEKNTMAITGSLAVTGGDVIVDGISTKSHHHIAQGEHARTTSAKK
ncbi:phage baseplate assembly protein V [Yersinia mollaretii]|uniref:phage baseplate assembly protein V n=1 Tax=Yersinia mollaretii TaxID=33060 RepID=UPI0011A2FC1E|nr:phage baseplate assembly protein V [Yersinia mollaretii]